ncbi:hypothetical protein PR202_gb08106 [Eleusine coracana subsp. coracana]|uniref:Uncharacterized protein n=1 Tax=Eleusine coracana subsp. coracana TaxID=191504 RepID=A0AAV5EBD4_ELECO|nr:hypothetical protein PR202_gb08106 [Eleusine coracana subsp. coracana]
MAAAAMDPVALGLGTSGVGTGGGRPAVDGAQPVDLDRHPSGIVPTLHYHEDKRAEDNRVGFCFREDGLHRSKE